MSKRALRDILSGNCSTCSHVEARDLSFSFVICWKSTKDKFLIKEWFISLEICQAPC